MVTGANQEIGLQIAMEGVVDAIGDTLAGVAIGDLVMGTADRAKELSACASDRAIMDHWTRIPPGLDPLRTAALPMAAETAYRSLESLGPLAGRVLMVHGAGTTVGFAVVQLASMRGARVAPISSRLYTREQKGGRLSSVNLGQGHSYRSRRIRRFKCHR